MGFLTKGPMWIPGPPGLKVRGDDTSIIIEAPHGNRKYTRTGSMLEEEL